MSRFTKKSNSILKEIEYQLIDEKENLSANEGIKKIQVLGTNKLGKLEDIEEQLGVDLITLFKALNVRDGVWVKDKEYGLCNWSMGQLWFGYNSSKSESFINPQIYFLKDGGYSYFKLSDYGKTWALTKEELENDN